jgi:hypothetical protein
MKIKDQIYLLVLNCRLSNFLQKGMVGFLIYSFSCVSIASYSVFNLFTKIFFSKFPLILGGVPYSLSSALSPYISQKTFKSRLVLTTWHTIVLLGSWINEFNDIKKKKDSVNVSHRLHFNLQWSSSRGKNRFHTQDDHP